MRLSRSGAGGIRARRGAVGLAGIASTVLLHSLLFVVVVWDEGQYRPNVVKQPDAAGAGANTGRPEGESGERRIRVLLSLQPIAQAPAPELEPQLSEAMFEAAALLVTGPDALPMPPIQFAEDGDPAETSNAELIARMKLAGLYESQVRARIERAWTLPAGVVQAEGPCRAKIHQTRDGRVSEVELDLSHCAGSPDWQQSLVNAIFTASPLPAPPHPGAFVDSFFLVFRAPAGVQAGPL